MRVARILSFDSGFMQGLIGANFLNLLCNNNILTASEIYSYFDIITSSGGNGIQALAYAYGKSPQNMIDFYTNLGPSIFANTDSTTGPISTSTKLKNSQSSTFTSFYTSDNLINALGSTSSPGLFDQIVTGSSNNMYNLKTNVLIPAVAITNSINAQINNTTYNNVLFSNMLGPDLIGQQYSIADVALASSAIPLYFTPHQITDPSIPSTVSTTYSSGELFAANSSALGWALDDLFTGETYDRVCILSVGSGQQNNLGFYNPVADTSIIPSWQINNFLNNAYYSAAVQSSQDGVDKQLQWLSLSGGRINNIDLYYYRFQVNLSATDNVNTELDNFTADLITYIAKAVQTQYNIDSFKIACFLQNSKI